MKETNLTHVSVSCKWVVDGMRGTAGWHRFVGIANNVDMCIWGRLKGDCM